MVSDAFCSLCGLKLRIVELFVCRDCGVLMCPFCLNHSRNRKNLGGIRCSCGSTEVRSVGVLRNWITDELLSLKKRLKKVAYRPVILYQRWERIFDEMTLLSKFFVIHSSQLRDAIEIIARNASFILENVREFACKFKTELDHLSQSKEYQVDALLQIRTHVRYLQKQVDVFDSVLKEKLIVAETEIERAERNLDHIQSMRKSLGQLSPILKTEPGEMVIGVVLDISLQGFGNKARKGLVLVSNKKIRVVELQSSRFLLHKPPRIVDEFPSADILSITVKSRRFRGVALDVYTTIGHRIFTGSLKALQNLKNYFQRSIDRDGAILTASSRTKLSQRKPWNVTEFKKKIGKILSLKDLIRNTEVRSSFDMNLFGNPEVNNSSLSDLLHQKQVAQRLLSTLKESMALGCIEPEDFYSQKDKIEEKIQKIDDSLLCLNNSEKHFSVPSW